MGYIAKLISIWSRKCGSCCIFLLRGCMVVLLLQFLQLMIIVGHHLNKHQLVLLSRVLNSLITFSSMGSPMTCNLV